jgi:hypothetical protein
VAAFEVPRGRYRLKMQCEIMYFAAEEEPCRFGRSKRCLARTGVEGQHQSTSKAGLGHEKSNR